MTLQEFLAMNREEIEQHITVDPGILLGKPVIRGTRIPVYLIVGFVESGHSPEEIVDDYPDLTLADVEAALAFTRSERERTEVRPLFGNA
jgi:uncharacterized protein (DUF433 family)